MSLLFIMSGVFVQQTENDTYFEFVFGNFLLLIKLSRAGALRRTYFLIWPY